MKVCIHRGTKEIGGTCVEIESGQVRIVLDIGLPLNSEYPDVNLPDVKGFLDFDSTLLGIFVSHAHLDHYGLAKKLKSGAPIYIGADAKKIINAARLFVPGGFEVKDSIDLKHRKPIELGPFTVTPYLVDHSAYDSYAFLVAAEGKRLFYSGDFRGHGRKGKLFKDFLKNPPENIDVLLMEGSTIGRGDSDFSYPTEDDLEDRLINILNETKGPALFWSSGQNIDRLVTANKASRKTGRLFIVDIYTASILRAIGNPRLPQPGWHGFRVYLPRYQKKVIIENQLFDFAKSFSDARVYPENLKGLASKSLILFRPSMRFDLENAQCLNDATLIYSMWPGYLEDAYQQKFLEWLKSKNIPLINCHTSGHAPIQDLKRLADAITPKRMVPIHTFEPERYHELFGKVHLEDDGVWWEVSSKR
jgi:ribonuclease J